MISLLGRDVYAHIGENIESIIAEVHFFKLPCLTFRAWNMFLHGVACKIISQTATKRGMPRKSEPLVNQLRKDIILEILPRENGTDFRQRE
jgi:hypothetical protein